MWSIRKSLGGIFSVPPDDETTDNDSDANDRSPSLLQPPVPSRRKDEGSTSSTVTRQDSDDEDGEFQDAPSPSSQGGGQYGLGRRRAGGRRHAAVNRRAGSPYSKPVMTSTPMMLRKRAVLGAAGTPATSGKGFLGLLRTIASPAISLLTAVSPTRQQSDEEEAEEEEDEDEEEEEVDEIVDDDNDAPLSRGGESAAQTKRFGKAAASQEKEDDVTMEETDGVIVIDDDEDEVPKQPAPSAPTQKFINFNLLSQPRTPGPSNIKDLSLPSAETPLALSSFSSKPEAAKAPTTRGALKESQPAKKAAAPFFEFTAPSPSPSTFSPFASSSTSQAWSLESTKKAGESAFSSGPLSVQSFPSRSENSAGLFSEGSKGFSFLNGGGGVAASSSSSSRKEGGASSSRGGRDVSPTRRVYEEISEFLTRKGNAPLTSDEAARIQNMIAQSTGANVTLQTPAPNKSFAMSISELNPPTVQPASFSQPLFFPANPASGRSSTTAPSLFGASTSTFTTSIRPPTNSSIISAARARARRRQLQYFGASMGSGQGVPRGRLPGSDRSGAAQLQGSVNAGKEAKFGARFEEPSAKRVRVHEQSGDDSAAQLILHTLEDLAPPPTSLLPTFTDKSAPINPYEKEVFSPAIVHQIPKVPVMPKVASMIREVKSSIAPAETKSALLKARISEKPMGGTPARPPEKNVGYAGTPAKSLTFPIVSQGAASSPQTFPIVSEPAPTVKPAAPAPPPAVSAFTFTPGVKVGGEKVTEKAAEVASVVPKSVFTFGSKPVALASSPMTAPAKEVVEEKKSAPPSSVFSFKAAPAAMQPTPAVETVLPDFKFASAPISPLSVALKAFESEMNSKPLPTFDFSKQLNGPTPDRSPLSEASRSKLLETTKSVTAAFSPEKPFQFVPSTGSKDVHWGTPSSSSPNGEVKPPTFMAFKGFGASSENKTLDVPATAPFTLPPAVSQPTVVKDKPAAVKALTPVFSFSGLNQTKPLDASAVAPAAAAADAGPPAPTPSFKFDWGAAGGKTGGAETKWQCGDCLVSNLEKETQCVACGGAKPGATAVVAKPFAFGAAVAPQTASPTEVAAPKAAGGFDWGSAGVVKPVSAGWGCSVCLVSNKAEASVCVACSTPKPGGGAVEAGKVVAPAAPKFNWGATAAVKEDVAAPSKGTEEAPAPVKFNWGAAAGKDDSAPAVVPKFNWGAAGGAVKPAAPTWECDGCLVRNKEGDVKCVACGSGKPGAAAAPVSGAAPPAASAGFTFGGGAAGFGTPASATKDGADGAVKAAPAFGGFSFLNSKESGGDKPAASTGFSFGTTTTSAPGFSFGANTGPAAPAPAAAGGFTFKSDPAGVAASPFSFGSTPRLTESSSATSSEGGGVSFGTTSSVKPTFSFGASGEGDKAKSDAAQPLAFGGGAAGFSFGGKGLNPQASPFAPQASGGFSFASLNSGKASGDVPASSPFGGATATPSFGFGTGSTTTPTFSFGSTPSSGEKKDGSVAPNAGFVFGTGPKKDEK
ncbi:hypothetical protein HDU67_008693 [Dinochytrium kinnereticum]|nr:hypothetical protein HDU67_008693 [Dinochytrium kinnereticum]